MELFNTLYVGEDFSLSSFYTVLTPSRTGSISS